MTIAFEPGSREETTVELVRGLGDPQLTAQVEHRLAISAAFNGRPLTVGRATKTGIARS